MSNNRVEEYWRRERAQQTMAAREAGNAPLAEWFSQHLTRRSFGKGMAWTAVLTAAGLTVYQVAHPEPEVSLDSLELQRKSGWNIGSTDKALAFDGSVTTDSR